MTNSNKSLLLIPAVLILGAVIILLAGCGNGSTSGNGKADAPAKVAPDFNVDTLDGKMVSLSDLKGKPLVINFAASWCGPCEVEAPVLAKVHEKYKDRVTFFGIAVNDKPDSQRAFAQRHGLTFPIGLDPNESVVNSYQKRARVPYYGIPTTFFIDADGNIVSFYVGPVTENIFDQKVSAILKGSESETGTTSTTGTSTTPGGVATTGTTTTPTSPATDGTTGQQTVPGATTTPTSPNDTGTSPTGGSTTTPDGATDTTGKVPETGAPLGIMGLAATGLLGSGLILRRRSHRRD
jgi:peroxiredoxin